MENVPPVQVLQRSGHRHGFRGFARSHTAARRSKAPAVRRSKLFARGVPRRDIQSFRLVRQQGAGGGRGTARGGSGGNQAERFMAVVRRVASLPVRLLMWPRSYLTHLDRIATSHYVPSDEDIMRLRLRTNGVVRRPFHNSEQGHAFDFARRRTTTSKLKAQGTKLSTSQEHTAPGRSGRRTLKVDPSRAFS